MTVVVVWTRQEGSEGEVHEEFSRGRGQSSCLKLWAAGRTGEGRLARAPGFFTAAKELTEWEKVATAERSVMEEVDRLRQLGESSDLDTSSTVSAGGTLARMRS